MDEQEKERLARSLKRHVLEVAMPGGAMPAIHPLTHPDATPFALAACAANQHLHHHIDDALREADPAWDAAVDASTLVRHAAFVTLSPGDAAYAVRLLGVSLAVPHDPRARNCIDSIMRHGWRRVWQTVHVGEAVSLEQFRTLHPAECLQDPDNELVVLIWYAGLCSIAVAETPAREALDLSLIKAGHRLVLEAAQINPASRARYDAALRYVRAWRSAAEGTDECLSVHLALARDVIRRTTRETADAVPDSNGLWSLALLLADADATLDDARAVGTLAALVTLHSIAGRRSVPEPSVPAAIKPIHDATPELEDLRSALVVKERDNRRIAGDLDKARERLTAREVEISRLLGILAARSDPEPEEQYTVHTIHERVLVAGGHETLIRNLQTWLPDSICIATNGKEDLDPAVLGTTRLVVVLTSYISHAFSSKVVTEAHKRDLPLLLLDWRSAKRILQEIDLTLQAQRSDQQP